MIYIFIIFAIIITFLLFGKKKNLQEKTTIKKVVGRNNGLETEWNKWKSTFDPANSSEIQRTFNTKVVGVTYKNKDGSDRQKIISNLKINEKLLLIPETYKEDWAIIVSRENFEQLGYLNSDLAPEISDLIIRRKSRVDAKLSSLTGGKGKTIGANIEILKYVVKNRPKREKKEKVDEKPYDPNIKMHRLSYQRNIQASKLERSGYIENAIELYRSIVDKKNLELNDSSMPFSRLAIIYRKRNDYDSEIEIIEKWKQMIADSNINQDRKIEELKSIEKRLDKAKTLKLKKK